MVLQQNKKDQAISTTVYNWFTALEKPNFLSEKSLHRLDMEQGAVLLSWTPFEKGFY